MRPWKYLVSLILSLSLVVVFYACRNTQQDPAPQLSADTGFDLGIVKNGYEQLVQNPTNAKTGNGKKEKTKKKKVNWNGAYTFNVDGQDKMIIPYELEEDIYYKNPDSSVASYSANTFFVVSKKGKDYEYELVTRFPDVKWLNRTKRTPFSGKVIIEDVNGEFKKGYVLDEGRQVQEFMPPSQSGRTSDWDCFLIATYISCAYVPSIGFYADCKWMYNEYSCYTSGSGGGGGYSTIIQGGFNSYGGGGGNHPRPYIGEYPDNLFKIYKLSSTLDAAQKFLVNEILYFYLRNCLNSIIYANIVASGWKFNFSVDPGIPGMGSYNPINNDFKFKETEAIVNDVFTEEIFHAYQNNYYPNGTTQYLGKDTPGRVNIEFEAWIMKDIMGTTGVNSSTGCCFASDDPAYAVWLRDVVTASGTKWPTWSAMQPEYYYWMDRFRQKYPQYDSPIRYDMPPNAFLTALNNSGCPR